MNSPSRCRQFSLREVAGLMVIIALAIAYWQERTARQESQARLDSLLKGPRLYIRCDNPFQKYSSKTSGISTLGLWQIGKSGESLQDPKIKLQLIRSDTLQLVSEIEAQPTFVGKIDQFDFAATFQNGAGELGLTPGAYIIRANCFEGEKLIVTGVTVLEVAQRK
jgi:hypothetical protein